MKDLNAYDEDAAVKIILGSARSMGIEVKRQLTSCLISRRVGRLDNTTE